MANVPNASNRVTTTAGAVASGTDLCCVVAPCATGADSKPVQYGNSAAIFADKGYSEGLEYSDAHIERTRKPILFCAIPITVPGVVSRHNTAGNTGSATSTVTAGADGVLGEHDGILSVLKGGTIGTDQILLGLSLDGGRNTRPVRIGTGTSYTPPYFGIVIGLGAGTLNTGEIIHTWHGSAPLGDTAAGMLAARTALAKQQKKFRSLVYIGDLQASGDAVNLLTQANAYSTANKREIYIRAGLYDRLPQAALGPAQVKMTGAPTLTFAEVGGTGDTITRSTGSFVADGFLPNDIITVGGTANGNNVTGQITAVTALVLTMGSTDLTPEGPVGGCTIVGTGALTFNEVGATGDTLVRSRGSWLDDGFRVGDKPTITGTATNNFTAVQGLTAVTATTLTFGTDDLTPEVIGASAVSVKTGQTKSVWMAALDAAFASVDGQYRIDLSAGRRRVVSSFSSWSLRRPLSWLASWREYTHDLHVPTWRKSDGPLDVDSPDSETDFEWNDETDGGAGSAARFTTARTYPNDEGVFITQSLTRAGDGNILSQTHNVAVVNLCATLVQRQTETSGIGRVGTLNKDGTATSDMLTTMESEVNAQLQKELSVNKFGEGPRSSFVKWSASKDDILNVPEALLTGVCQLELEGTIHDVATNTRVN